MINEVEPVQHDSAHLESRTQNDCEDDLAFCRWMRRHEPWALSLWKNAWRVETSQTAPSNVRNFRGGK